jgi:ankyrin repeat protein
LASQPMLANQIFDDRWLELCEETGQEPDVPPSLIPTTKRRKSSQFSSLIHKLLKSDQKIIQAASDGNAAEVERLLSVGVNVNTKDKWGWTAMSMAAYGGHAEVARVLISHGASLDHEDVDHDTPLTLARNKGHRALVMMIEEETTRRATEGVE